VIRVMENLDFSGLDLILEARSIDIRASITAGGISLQSDTVIGMTQTFTPASGLGRVNVLTADRIRLESRGGIGDIFRPLYLRAGVVEAVTQGAAGIYLVELGNAVIGDVNFGAIGADTAGLSSAAGGNIHFTALGGNLTIDSAIQANGGRIVLTSERMAVNAEIASRRTSAGGQLFRGSLVLQTLSVNTTIGLATTGTNATQTLHFSADEINRFMTGFDNRDPATFLVNGRLVTSPFVPGITFGRANGRHAFTLASFTYTESITFRAPELGGRFTVNGNLSLIASPVDGDIPTLTFLGGNS